MAYTTIKKPSDYFNTKIFTGDGSLPRAITGVGHQPDFVWLKNRDVGYHHQLYDSVRGTSAGVLYTSNTDAEDSTYQMSSFDSDGYTMGSNLGAVNGSGENIVSWSWLAGTTGTGYTTGSGTSKAYSYSVNTTSGFSIIKFEGNGTAGHTIPHHLGAVPKIVMAKNLDNTGGYGWYVHVGALNDPEKILYLHSTDAGTNNNSAYNTTTPSSTVVTLGTNTGTNGNGENIILYCFAEKTGYSKFGSYVGNGNANGTFVYTGFKPAFVMTKRTNGSDWWGMWDSKRDSFNEATKNLRANVSDAEGPKSIDILSNGFKLRNTDPATNASGGTYIYMAFAEEPLVGDNPATAR